ncbi:MAG: FecR family protein [bacterium]
MTNHQSFDINHYFLRWQDGRLSSAEKKELQEWLTEPENGKAWDRLQAVWHAAGVLPVPQGTSQDAQWKMLVNRLDAQESAAQAVATKDSAVARWLGAIPVPLARFAAAAGVAVLVLILAYQSDFPGAGLQAVTVPLGQQIELTLQDGSQVHLNAGSTLEYPKKFNSEVRQVWLKGEGYFAVHPDHDPFVVETAQARTRVLGTEFNVRTWDSATEVFVTSGRVAVHSHNAVQASEAEVLPGQLAICNDGPITVQPTEPGALLSWRQGRLVFVNRPLASALGDIERMYEAKISAAPSLRNLSISATFAKEPVETIVETLAATLNARVERTGEGYRLTPK